MKIVIIGSGNLATQLSLALSNAGQQMLQVFSKTEEHARELAGKLGCGYTANADEIDGNADVYIISVKDDAISGIATKIGEKARNAIVVHTAGSIAMDVLKGKAQHYGVFSAQRKKIHLAAVLACNFTNHCYRLAEKVLQEEQIDFKLFLPLIDETARKVSVLSPKQAQTGPMMRWDTGVMNMQIDLLSDERTKQIYRLMAESIHEDATSTDDTCHQPKA